MPRVLRAFLPIVCALVALALVLGPGAPRARAQVASGVIRVAPSGSDTGGCGSEAQPCASIQFAVDEAADLNDSTRFQSVDIRVASGTYTGGGANVVLLARSGSISLRGGFSTTNWNVSDPAANVSTIDGQNARRGVYIIVGVGNPCNVTVSGFTITRGRSSADDPFGGGLLVDNCAVSLSDLTVTDSRALGSDAGDAGPKTPGAGGGIALRGVQASGTTCQVTASATLRNITLRGNRAQGGAGGSGPRGGLSAGGGLYSLCASVSGGGIVASGNVTQGGDAPGSAGVKDGQRADGLGGGISLILSTLALDDVLSQQNTAQGGGAGGLGGFGQGGGIFIELSSGTLTRARLNGNTVTGGASTSANGSGGGALGGGIFVTDSDISASTVEANANTVTGGSGSGAGAHAGYGSGGGLMISRVQASANVFRASNIVLAGNAITTGAGAVRDVAFGSGSYCDQSQLVLNHATIAANAISGPGFNFGPALASTNACVTTLTNSIVADHAGTSPIYVGDKSGTTTLTTNLFSGNVAPNVLNDFNSPVSEQGSFAGSPAFAAPGAPNFDYHLTSGSAAIDKAQGSTLATDLDGQRRPFGAASDVGADEYSTQIVASATTSGTTITLTWRRPPVLPLAGYAVVYAKEAGASDAQQPSPIAGIAASATSFTLSGLTSGKTYTVSIIARDGGGNQVGASDSFALRAGGYAVFLPLVYR